MQVLESQELFEFHQLLFDKVIRQLPASTELLTRIKVTILDTDSVAKFPVAKSISWSMNLF